MSEAVATAVRTEPSLVARRMSSRASTLVGSARATVSTSWARVTGMALWRRATLRGSTASVSSGMGQAAQVQEGQAELVGEGAGDLDLVGQAEGDDDLPQPPATALVLALDAQGLVQLRLGEDPPGDQHLAEPATPTRRPARGPARAHLGGSPLSWFRARPGSIGSRGPRVDVRRPSPRHWPP